MELGGVRVHKMEPRVAFGGSASPKRSLEALGGVDYLAELLAGGPAWQRSQAQSELPSQLALWNRSLSEK